MPNAATSKTRSLGARRWRLPAQALLLLVLTSGCRGGIAPSEGTGHGADPGSAESLLSLPYADRAYDPESHRRGVVHFDRAKAQPGLNFYSSFDAPAAFLVDMEGKLLYQWRFGNGAWQHAELKPNGHVVFLLKHVGVYEVDRESNLIWSYRSRAHHDLWVSEDERHFVLTNEIELIEELHPEAKIFNEYVTILSDRGVLIDNISFYEMFRNSEFAHRLPDDPEIIVDNIERLSGAGADIFHSNHIEGFDRPRTDQFRWYRPGHVLISFRHMDAIAIADLEARRIVWMWGTGRLRFPHHSTVLDNGNILVFNNRVEEQGSEILELDPRTEEVVWSYTDDEFFSETRGSNLRLDNGNTLITESDTGYVFEVTPGGETVWTYANPRVRKQERAAIWRMYRHDPRALPFLDEVELRHPLGDRASTGRGSGGATGRAPRHPG